jgi:flagellar basal-body rod protein FlgC
MSYDQIYSILSDAMRLEKLRIDVVANNIANQYSLDSSFQPLQVVAKAKPFSSYLTTKTEVRLVPNKLPPNRVYQPEHPAADQKGYLSYPGLSMVDEMTTLLQASRAYEADVKIMNTAHSLYLQALRIGEER